MTEKKRYIPPYIEFVEEEPDYVLCGGIGIASNENVDEERHAKEGFFIDDDDTSDFIWDNNATDECEIQAY